MMVDFFDGKKTILSLIVALIAMLTGVEISEGEVSVAMDSLQAIVANVAIIMAFLSKLVSNGKPFWR